MDAYTQEILQFRCPRWNQLPEVDLYMDQVLSVLEQKLSLFAQDEKVVTSTMINNYVKQKQIQAPVKKKYDRRQLARLFVICLLKGVFSLGEIAQMLQIVLGRYGAEEAFDLFGQELEASLRLVFLGEEEAEVALSQEQEMMRAVLKTFAYKLYAQNVVRLNAPAPEPEKEKDKDKKKESAKN